MAELNVKHVAFSHLLHRRTRLATRTSNFCKLPPALFITYTPFPDMFFVSSGCSVSKTSMASPRRPTVRAIALSFDIHTFVWQPPQILLNNWSMTSSHRRKVAWYGPLHICIFVALNPTMIFLIFCRLPSLTFCRSALIFSSTLLSSDPPVVWDSKVYLSSPTSCVFFSSCLLNFFLLHDHRRPSICVILLSILNTQW